MIKAWIARITKNAAVTELKIVKEEHEVVVSELSNVRVELRKTKEELEDVKLKKKIEEEDIKHMVKIKLEQNEIEFQKKIITSDKEREAAIHIVKQEYADKMQARLEKEVVSIKEMYREILQRIPDVNVRLKGEV